MRLLTDHSVSNREAHAALMASASALRVRLDCAPLADTPGGRPPLTDVATGAAVRVADELKEAAAVAEVAGDGDAVLAVL